MSQAELIKVIEALNVKCTSSHPLQISVGLSKEGNIEVLIEDEVMN